MNPRVFWLRNGRSISDAIQSGVDWTNDGYVMRDGILQSVQNPVEAYRIMPGVGLAPYEFPSVLCERRPMARWDEKNPVRLIEIDARAAEWDALMGVLAKHARTLDRAFTAYHERPLGVAWSADGIDVVVTHWCPVAYRGVSWSIGFRDRMRPVNVLSDVRCRRIGDILVSWSIGYPERDERRHDVGRALADPEHARQLLQALLPDYAWTLQGQRVVPKLKMTGRHARVRPDKALIDVLAASEMPEPRWVKQVKMAAKARLEPWIIWEDRSAGWQVRTKDGSIDVVSFMK